MTDATFYKFALHVVLHVTIKVPPPYGGGLEGIGSRTFFDSGMRGAAALIRYKRGGTKNADAAATPPENAEAVSGERNNSEVVARSLRRRTAVAIRKKTPDRKKVQTKRRRRTASSGRARLLFLETWGARRHGPGVRLISQRLAPRHPPHMLRGCRPLDPRGLGGGPWPLGAPRLPESAPLACSGCLCSGGAVGGAGALSGLFVVSD